MTFFYVYNFFNLGHKFMLTHGISVFNKRLYIEVTSGTKFFILSSYDVPKSTYA